MAVAWTESELPERGLLPDVLFGLVSRLGPKLASSLLFIFLLRQAGASDAGTYSLAIAFLTAGILLGSLGLDELVIREVAKDPTLSRRYLANALFLRAILAVICFGAIAVLVGPVMQYDAGVRHIVLLQNLALVPESLSAVFFSVFNANRKLRWMAFVSLLVGGFQLAGGGIALWLHTGLESVVWVLLTGSLVGTVLSAIISYKMLPPARSKTPGVGDPGWRFPIDLAFCIGQLRATLPFALIVTLVSLDAQIDVLFLSALRGVAEVGVYSGARTIILLLSLIPQSFRMAVYPTMARAYVSCGAALRSIYRQSWRYMAIVGLPLAAVCTLLAPQIADLVYGAGHTGTAWSLGILAWHLLVGFLYIPGTRLMVVSDHQMILAAFSGLSLALNVFLNLALTPQLGANGTAIARSVASVLYFACVEVYVARNLLPGSGGPSSALKPLAASVSMSALLWVLGSQPMWLTLPAGLAVYGIVLVAIGGVTPAERAMAMSAVTRRFQG
jgi:O-antigen/teichoic acid export membrane protein